LEVGIAVLDNLKKIAFVLGCYIKINVGAGLVSAQNNYNKIKYRKFSKMLVQAKFLEIIYVFG
jgi:hypothetical protein